jgi:GTP-binding protein HflX
MRELRLDSGRRIILSDTVGFISDLPTSLIAAFRATLEEVIEADLILHVRDISHAETAAQRADVEAVLTDLGIDTEHADSRILEVWNKSDLLDANQIEQLQHAANRADSHPLLVSAITGDGLDDLRRSIDARLGRADEILTISVPATAGGLLAWLHENTEILERETSDSGETRCRVRIEAAKKGRLAGRLRREGIEHALI